MCSRVLNHGHSTPPSIAGFATIRYTVRLGLQGHSSLSRSRLVSHDGLPSMMLRRQGMILESACRPNRHSGVMNDNVVTDNRRRCSGLKVGMDDLPVRLSPSKSSRVVCGGLEDVFRTPERLQVRRSTTCCMFAWPCPRDSTCASNCSSRWSTWILVACDR